MYRKTLLAIAATFTALSAFSGTFVVVTNGSPVANAPAQVA